MPLRCPDQRRATPRLAVRRYAGGYVLTELWRWACAAAWRARIRGSEVLPLPRPVWPSPGPSRSPRGQVRKLEQQDANLRRARTAGPRAAERITLDFETLGAELAAAMARLNEPLAHGAPHQDHEEAGRRYHRSVRGHPRTRSARNEGRDLQRPVRARRRRQPRTEGSNRLEHDDRPRC
jgi:hypothetical protein